MKKILYSFILFKLIIFQTNNVFSIHHHERMLNVHDDTNLLWKKRLLLVRLNESELTDFKVSVDKEFCHIQNRNLEIYFERDKKYINLFNKKLLKLNFTIADKILLVGYDGSVKIKSENLVNFKNIFEIIDQMPIRKSEIIKDKICN